MKTLNTILISLLTGAVSAQVGIGTSTPSTSLDIESSGAAIDINNTAVDGDPKINFQLSGTTTFSMGIDDGDSDKLKIGTTAPDASTAITIDASQNVGVGTTTPTVKLDVDGSAIFNESGADSDFRIESDGSTHMFFVDASSNMVGIGTSSPTYELHAPGNAQFGTGNSKLTVNTGSGFFSNHGTEIYANVGTGYSVLNVKSDHSAVSGINLISVYQQSNPVLVARMDHRVGIATASPGYTLTVNGQPAANGYTAFTNYSDKRLKTNIDSLDAGALDKILQLNPVSFQYNEKYTQLYPNSDLGRVHKGFIAQEIQKVFPEMVSEMKESPDSINYLDLDISHLQVYLVKALQEQQAIIEAQKNEIETQKAELDTQKVETSSNTSASTNNAEEIEALKAQLQQLLQLIQQQESASVGE